MGKERLRRTRLEMGSAQLSREERKELFAKAVTRGWRGVDYKKRKTSSKQEESKHFTLIRDLMVSKLISSSINLHTNPPSQVKSIVLYF